MCLAQHSLTCHCSSILFVKLRKDFPRECVAAGPHNKYTSWCVGSSHRHPCVSVRATVCYMLGEFAPRAVRSLKSGPCSSSSWYLAVFGVLTSPEEYTKIRVTGRRLKEKKAPTQRERRKSTTKGGNAARPNRGLGKSTPPKGGDRGQHHSEVVGNFSLSSSCWVVLSSSC